MGGVKKICFFLYLLQYLWNCYEKTKLTKRVSKFMPKKFEIDPWLERLARDKK
jgi:hypothetical protein